MTLYGTEVLGNDGPTGIVVEVLELAISDYGDNELWRGTPGEAPEFHVPTQCVATKTGRQIQDCDVLI